MDWEEAKSLKKPRQLEFKGDGAREKRAARGGNSCDWQMLSFKYSADYWLARASEETKAGEKPVVTMPSTDTGPGIVPGNNSLGEPQDSQG